MPVPVVHQRYDEVKVLYPLYRPNGFDWCGAKHLWVSPVDTGDPQTTQENLQAAIRFVHDNPEWRLNTQLHKEVKIP
jgi:predicted metalloprotease with PDZ domain